jgi:hypothetical protein
MKLRIVGIEIDMVYFFAGITPIFYYGGNILNPQIAFQQMVFFQVIALLFLGVCHFNKWIGAFIVWSCLQALFLPCDMFLKEALFVGMGAMIYHMIASSKWEGKYLPLVITAVLFVNAVFCALQYFHTDIYFMQNNYQSSGLFLLPVFLGMYAAIVAPYLLRWNKLAWVLALFCVLFSRSSFCVIGIFIGTAFYLFHANRKHFKIFAAVGLVGALLFVFVKDAPSGEFGRRAHVWQMVFSKAMRSPLWGYGVGQYQKTLFIEMSSGMSGVKKESYFNVTEKSENEKPLKDLVLKIAHESKIDTTRLESVHFNMDGGIFKNFGEVANELNGRGLNVYNWEHCHNELLQIFYNQGLIGILIVLGYIVNMWGRYNKYSKSQTALFGSFIAFLCVSLVQFPLYLPCVICLVIVLLAILDSKLNEA